MLGEKSSHFVTDVCGTRALEQGFRKQTEGWPQQPVDAAIAWLKERDSALVVADFGCGDARLAASVPQKVYSLDVVAATPDVIACNMAETPLGTALLAPFSKCTSQRGSAKEKKLTSKAGPNNWEIEKQTRHFWE